MKAKTRPRKRGLTPFQRLAARGRFNLRPQAGWKQQRELEAEEHRCLGLAANSETALAKFASDAERLVKLESSGQFIHAERMGEALQKVEDERRKLSAYKQRLKDVRVKIAELERGAKAEEPRQRQVKLEFCRRGDARLALDEAIASWILQLHQMLSARADLSVQMRELAVSVGLCVENDALDEARFETLFASLPTDTFPRSAQWARWFSGEEPGKKRYIVRAESLALPETLACSGWCDRGETIWLTEQQASELLLHADPAYLPIRELEDETNGDSRRKRTRSGRHGKIPRSISD